MKSFDKVKAAIESAKTVAKNAMEGKDLTVSEQSFNSRMECCGKCDKHVKSLNQCGECGCFLAVKAKLAGMKCPLGKWAE